MPPTVPSHPLEPAADLPPGLVAAAAAMRRAFASGTDTEAQAAAAALTDILRSLPPHLAAVAEEHLVQQASAASAERSAHLIRTQLPAATVLGTRPLPDDHEVVTLLLGDGSEVAVVVPVAVDEPTTVHRAALLGGTCPACAAELDAAHQVTHRPGCPAA